MKLFVVAFFVSLLLFQTGSCSFVQSSEIRKLCREAQKQESILSKVQAALQDVNKREKMSLPTMINVYEILSRCCTVLSSIQRFSNMLIISKYQSKNDFIRCSIVIKSFADYFKNMSLRLGRGNAELVKLQREKSNLDRDYTQASEKYRDVCKKIDEESKKLAETREENVIQNDVVYHIATKSESIEELDAELEAENVVGVLRNNKVSTDLSLAYPVNGKIVAEFGDRGDDGSMICYIGFETNQEAIVTSPAKGLVVFSGNFLNYQNMVIISNGEYRIFLYGINKIFAATGDVVEIGDYIGQMDDKSKDPPILKMELRRSGEPLDPRHWLMQTIEKGKK
ncbi:MAG: peptidoglycan DD-metalloendopeptidase family protein [Alphaproteobacteria bacterium]|nr:peptidoglycan DD-metalloendopeptidase family protein [Alphaproteobacteria bacterium]